MDRLTALRTLIDTRYGGRVVDFAKAIGKAPSLVSQWRGEHRKLGDASARHIEIKLNLGAGWFDQPVSPEGAAPEKPAAPGPGLLGAMAVFPDEQAAPDGVDESGQQRWVQQIRAAILASQPDWSARFQRRIHIGSEQVETRIDYVGDRIIAQFGRLIPGPALPGSLIETKAKLWDLFALKDEMSRRGLRGRLSHVVLIYHPGSEDPAYSERDIGRSLDAMKMLSDASSRNGLIVHQVKNAAEAAEFILKLDATPHRATAS
jgi:hypothetical protein